MYKSTNLSILNRVFSTGKIFIRNTELPICSNCVHFIEHTNNYPYDSMPSDTLYGKCKKFGEINLVTGAFEYDLAKYCRLDISKCGYIGLEYSTKTQCK